jgi:hypothetical protein
MALLMLLRRGILGRILNGEINDWGFVWHLHGVGLHGKGRERDDTMFLDESEECS